MKNAEKEILIEMAQVSDEIFFVFSVETLSFTYVNEAFSYFTKKSKDDLHANPKVFLEMIHPEDRSYILKQFDKLLVSKVNNTLSFRIIRTDGMEKWVRLKVCPITENGKVSYLSGLLEDDSERKLGMLNMQSVNGWKDSTLEVLAHDLRGPIGIVHELTKALEKKLSGHEAPEVMGWLRMIREISRRNIDLVHSIVKRESLQTVEVPGSIERVEVVAEVAKVMDIYHTSQLRSQRTFVFTHSHEKLYADLDNMKYLQIINNLVSNAIKFTKDGGEISVHLTLKKESFVTVVKDNGIGIPADLQKVLFQKYTPAGRRGTDGQESIGLGMWIVKSYVNAHGGTIQVESEENKGTSFVIELPLLQKAKHS